jgi:GNAT superfamily N-acetyltransferase
MITVSTVTTRKEFHDFFTFPVTLYTDNPHFVPSLIFDEKWNFDPKKNPAYDHVETICFLAKEDGKIVGRIAGLINHKLNEQNKTKEVRFNRYDVVDDIEVSRMLIEQVSQWGKERGMDTIIGPIGFSDLDKEGMLIEGFDQPGMFITLYNHPYYVEHMNELQFEKEVDWVEYKVSVPKEMDPRIERITNIAMKRNGYKLMTFTSKRKVIPYMKKAFAMYNDSFKELYGFYPLTDAQVDMTIKQFVSLVTLEYLFIVTDKDEEVLGFGLMVPSLAEAVRKSKGRLLPTGIFRIKHALKHHTVLDMYLIAVKPEYIGRGVNAIIMNAGIKQAIKNGIEFAETGPELEDNLNVQSQWKSFETQQHKRRRCFRKSI